MGTTKSTRLADYARAIGPETGLLRKVHRSNVAMVGFAEAPSLEAEFEVAIPPGKKSVVTSRVRSL